MSPELPRPEPLQAALPRPEVVPLRFDDQRCLAIYQPAASDLLVLMINGGAQIRAGSHRLYQQLAQHWQQAGIASLRFDFPGFGDADGEPADFVRHAHYLQQLPAQLAQHFGRQRPVVCFGLCDGATAALLAAPALAPRALLLLNPWLRTTEGHASTMLKFYYLNQLKDRQFWQKLLKGQLDWRRSLRELSAFWHRRADRPAVPPSATSAAGISATHSQTGLSVPAEDRHLPAPDRQQQAVGLALKHWLHYQGPCLLALAEPDLTAAECQQALRQKPWRLIWRRSQRLLLPQANHTLSRQQDLQTFSAASSEFLQALCRR